MYSREESQKLKREFWVAFAEKYPRKWVLYDTKIKDFSFKFFVDNKKAQVLIDIEPRSDEKRTAYFEKNYTLESGKTISRIWIEKQGVGFSNRNNWDAIFDFFFEKMHALEMFYLEYDEFIKDIS